MLKKYENYIVDVSLNNIGKRLSYSKIFSGIFAVIVKDVINHNNILEYLKMVENDFFETKDFNRIIVIANTNDEFEQDDLLYFDGNKLVVTFFLIRGEEKFYFEKWDSFLGYKAKKILKKFSKL